jgi:glycosyltransferase involved in cell wall biosynthesis
MKGLFDDEQMRGRLGEAAAEVRERFSREKIMQQWEDVILDAMAL